MKSEKAVDANLINCIFREQERSNMDEKILSGYYSTINLNPYNLGIKDYTFFRPLETSKIGEFWDDLEALIKIDIERDVLDKILNYVLLEYSIQISDVDLRIYTDLSPDVVALIYVYYINLFLKNVGDKLYRDSNDKLFLLSKPLSEIVDVDDGEWEDEDIKEFIVYRKKKED